MVETIPMLIFEYGPKILMSFAVLYLGLKAISWITQISDTAMKSQNVDASLRPFLISLINAGMKVMLILSVAGMFGIQTTSFVAVLGAMTFAVGMALQGSLGNFASGVMLLLFKPYKVGDLVQLHDYTGVVEEIQIFNTVLITPDNRTVILPNSIVTTGAITNISGQGEIRVDMVFGIGYDDDIDHARAVILSVADQCEQVSKIKPVDVFVGELADSAVNFHVRPWCKSEDYWNVYFYMHENIKKAFDDQDINIPYPQMDLNLPKVKENVFAKLAN